MLYYSLEILSSNFDHIRSGTPLFLFLLHFLQLWLKKSVFIQSICNERVNLIFRIANQKDIPNFFLKPACSFYFLFRDYCLIYISKTKRVI